MKKETVFTMATGKKLTLCLTIKDMMKAERDMGRSLFAEVAGISRGSLQGMDLRFTMACLRWSLPTQQTDEELEQIIEDHCMAGGTLDDINRVLLQTLFATGLFTPGKNGDKVAVKA